MSKDMEEKFKYRRILFLLFCIIWSPPVTGQATTVCGNKVTVNLTLGTSQAFMSRGYPMGIDDATLSTCAIEFQAPIGCRIRIAFVNAYIQSDVTFFGLVENESSIISNLTSTVANGYLIRISAKNYANFSVNSSGAAIKYWNGFYGLATAFEQDDTYCPAVGNSVQLNTTNFFHLTSSWHPEDENMTFAAQTCVWQLSTMPGYRIKIMLNHVGLAQNERLNVKSENETKFEWNNQSVLIHRAIYINSSKVDVTFVRQARQQSGKFIVVTASAYEPDEVACNETETEILGGSMSEYPIEKKGDHANGTYNKNFKFKWRLRVDVDYEMHVVQAYAIMERGADYISFTSSNYDNITDDTSDVQTIIYPANSSVDVDLVTDGNIELYGYCAVVYAVYCKCDPAKSITLNATNPNETLELERPPSNYRKDYCNGLRCGWLISAPPGYVIQVIPSGKLRPVAGDLLIFHDQNITTPFLRVNGSTTMSRIVSSSTNNVSVSFTSALIHHDNREIDGWWSANVSILRLQVDRNVTRVLDDSMPSYFVATTAIPMFTALTVIGNLNRTIYGELEMYIGAFNNQYNPEFTNAMDFLIIDGESIAGRSLGRLTDFATIGGIGPAPPVNSSTGSFTILLLNSSNNPFYNAIDVLLYFRQPLLSDPCQSYPVVAISTNVSEMTVIQNANPNSSIDTRCPITIIPITQPPNTSSRLKISKILYSGVGEAHLIAGGDPGSRADVNKSALISFNSNNFPQWTEAGVYGRIFTLLAPANANMTFAFTSSFGSLQRVSSSTGTLDIVMSTNYPNANTQPLPNITYGWSSLNQESLTVTMDLTRIDLGTNSTLSITAFTHNLFLQTGGSSSVNSTQFCSSQFQVAYAPQGLNQTGFLIQYEVGGSCRGGYDDGGGTTGKTITTCFFIVIAAFFAFI